MNEKNIEKVGRRKHQAFKRARIEQDAFRTLKRFLEKAGSELPIEFSYMTMFGDHACSAVFDYVGAATNNEEFRDDLCEILRAFESTGGEWRPDTTWVNDGYKAVTTYAVSPDDESMGIAVQCPWVDEKICKVIWRRRQEKYPEFVCGDDL